MLRWAPEGECELDDGTVVSACRGLLPRRLGLLHPPVDVIRRLTMQRLPWALGHRRVLRAYVDADGYLRRLALTTLGDGVRRPAKWLVLDLSELGTAAEVPPRVAVHTLTGTVPQQFKQQFDAVRDGAPWHLADVPSAPDGPGGSA